MPVPVHNRYFPNTHLGFHDSAYRDPTWETCTPQEIVESNVGRYILYEEQPYTRGGRTEEQAQRRAGDVHKGVMIEHIEFYRNAQLRFTKPKILRNTNGLIIPSPDGEGFSLNPGIEVHYGTRTIQYSGPNGLFRDRYGYYKHAVGWRFTDAAFPNNDFGLTQHQLELITTACRTNIDRIHSGADPVCESRRLASPELLNQYLAKHKGNPKVAEQLSVFIRENGWFDKDPEVLFSVLEFCKNNTQGIRDFSTWVRTHKAQIKLLDLETVKQAIGLASVMMVQKE